MYLISFFFSGRTLEYEIENTKNKKSISKNMLKESNPIERIDIKVCATFNTYKFISTSPVLCCHFTKFKANSLCAALSS